MATLKTLINPCLWFDKNAEEAANFYVSVFPNSKILSKSYYLDGMQLPKGTVLTVTFELNGQQFLALNGGPLFKFTEAVSFMIYCDTQQEIDSYWQKLTSNGGQDVECGWVKDKFGLSWQIVPSQVSKWLDSNNPAGFERYMRAMMTMKKMDIAKLEKAYNG